MKFIAAAFIIFAPASAVADNYATCLLKNLPGIHNDPAARAAINLCLSEHPGGNNSVQQGSGRGLFSYKSGAECAMKKAGSTQSQLAGTGIYVACRKLYDEPAPWLDPFGN